MWQNESVVYQIYPLGFCGAPIENDGATSSRIKKILDWVEYLAGLGIGAVMFNPVFQSDRHGYDTRDYSLIDSRLGVNEDFAAVCGALRERGIRVMLDGVFNHVGRGFWAFQDVLKNREASPYKDWFYVRFDCNNGYGDGLSYEGWEGHYDLVKLNLRNQNVVGYLFERVKGWVEEFDIDGLRLDVAYCLDRDFLKALRNFCEGLKPDFFLMGETLFGDYNQLVNKEMLHSCTNYECYKGIHSSFNNKNMFEIAHSLNRQFGPEMWALYKRLPLFSFVDNHDVSRIASILNDKRHVPLAYGLLFGIPGIPCLYYGSEWGATGDKKDGDWALRPEVDLPGTDGLVTLIGRFIKARREHKALSRGDYRNVVISSQQLVFERYFEDERILVAINAGADDCVVGLDIGGFGAIDILTGSKIRIEGSLSMPSYSVSYLLQATDI